MQRLERFADVGNLHCYDTIVLKFPREPDKTMERMAYDHAPAWARWFLDSSNSTHEEVTMVYFKRKPGIP